MARTSTATHIETQYTVVDTATDTTTVSSTPAVLYGIYVNTVLSAHLVLITDGATTVITLPASTAAGTFIRVPGCRFLTSLIVDPDNSSTGNITLYWRPDNIGIGS